MILAAVSPKRAGDCPFAVDTGSLRVRTSRGEKSSAAVTLTVFNVSNTTSPETRAALVTPEGENRLESLATLPALAPGASTGLELRREWSQLPADEPSLIRFDAYGQIPGSAAWPRVPVHLGLAALPDLVIPPGGVTAETTAPSDGETVFFDVLVENRGTVVGEGWRVEAFDQTSSVTAPLESRITQRDPVPALGPGQSARVRLRWDPFRNAGPRALLFRVVAGADAPDRDPSNNEFRFDLRVLTKARLRPAGIRALERNAEDLRLKRVRIAARVANAGETAARGVRVVFFSSREHRNPANQMGEVIVEEIMPGQTHEAVLEYSLRLQDAGRPFNLSFEVSLKGSLQRVPSQ